MRVRYTPNRHLYDEYYSQTGRGYPVYIGGMRGAGLGSVLSGLFRSAVPLLKKGGKALTILRKSKKQLEDRLKMMNKLRQHMSKIEQRFV